jgi:hypothetical protein
MADIETADEKKVFNVKNTSLRLVHIGELALPPEQVGELLDDEKGINRKTVEKSLFLEETDEAATIFTAKPNDIEQVEEAEPVKPVAKKKTGKPAASWGSAS